MRWTIKLRLRNSHMVGVAILLSALTVISACASAKATATPVDQDPTPEPFTDFHPRLGDPFSLTINGSAFMSEGGYRITFVRVVSDNRCPVDTTCVTAGEAVVELAVRETINSIEQTYEWTLGSESIEPSARSIGGLVIELMEVEPIPGGMPGTAKVTLLVSEAFELPLLSLSASVEPAELPVGDTIKVRTDAGGAGLAQYMLITGDTALSVLHHSGIEVQRIESEIITVISYGADRNGAEWTLRADAPAHLELRLFVTGEIKVGQDVPWIFTHGTETFQLNIRPR